MRALVILPTYNEADNVLELVRAVLESDPRLEAVVVDDGSPDGTGELVERERANEPRLHLLQRGAKLGIGSAYLAGFRYGFDGGYDRILTMDCDGSHHPRHLPALLAGTDDHGLAIGSRYVPGGGITNWSLPRRLLSRFASFYTRTLLRLPVRDCTSGYRCYRSEVLERVAPFEVRSSGYSFLEEMVWRVHRAGFDVVEVPIVFEDRLGGESKIDNREILLAAWHVLRTALWPPTLPGAADRGSGDDSS